MKQKNENEDTKVTKVSEPNTDVKITENIKSIVTEAVVAPRATQTMENSNATEIEEPRYEHRETSKIATEDAVPREKSKISKDAVPREKSGILEDADPRYEHRENADTATEDAVPREISKEVTGLAGNTGISQATPCGSNRRH